MEPQTTTVLVTLTNGYVFSFEARTLTAAETERNNMMRNGFHHTTKDLSTITYPPHMIARVEVLGGARSISYTSACISATEDETAEDAEPVTEDA